MSFSLLFLSFMLPEGDVEGFFHRVLVGNAFEEVDAGASFDLVHWDCKFMPLGFLLDVRDDEAYGLLACWAINDFVECLWDGYTVAAYGGHIVGEDGACEDIDGVVGARPVANAVFDGVPDAAVETVVLR